MPHFADGENGSINVALTRNKKVQELVDDPTPLTKNAWLSLPSIPLQRASGLTRSFGRHGPLHPPHTTLSSDLHIFSERPNSGNGKVMLLP